MERKTWKVYVAALIVSTLAGTVVFQTGCGSLGLDDFLADNACNIFNCETLFFIDDMFAPSHEDTADDHDDMDMEDDQDDDMAEDQDGVEDDHDDMLHEDADDDHEDTDVDHDDATDDGQLEG